MDKKINALKCLACGTDNKETAKTCKKCGRPIPMEQLWQPTWRWHLKVLCCIYLALTIVYFAVNTLLKKAPEPYRLRTRPMEITPWLKK